MRTVEGRARQHHPSQMKNTKTLLEEMARFEKVRNQAGSRLEEGKKGSIMAIEDATDDNYLFVSQ